MGRSDRSKAGYAHLTAAGRDPLISQMQHDALPKVAVAWSPDGMPGLVVDSRPGRDAPYAGYVLGAPYDEMFAPDGDVRAHCAALHARIATMPPEELIRRQQA